MAEAWFYHLTESPLEATAPDLLERCLGRGWRVLVRAGTPARVSALDHLLWTYRDESFLPHGTSADPRAERQPVYLTSGREAPNAPDALMLVDGAEASPEEMGRFERCMVVFDGHDPQALQQARGAWKAVSASGMKALYWAQEDGRWVKRAESGG